MTTALKITGEIIVPANERVTLLRRSARIIKSRVNHQVNRHGVIGEGQHPELGEGSVFNMACGILNAETGIGHPHAALKNNIKLNTSFKFDGVDIKRYVVVYRPIYQQILKQVKVIAARDEYLAEVAEYLYDYCDIAVDKFYE